MITQEPTAHSFPLYCNVRMAHMSGPRPRRSFHSVLALGCAWLLSLLMAPVQAQDANDGFNPNVNGDVNALVVQADGKLLLGGNFSAITIAGVVTPRNGIARLNPDGSLDYAYDPNVSGSVYALALQADGSVVLGGSFSAIGGTPTTNNHIARFNSFGVLDTTFNPNVNGAVAAVVVQADGKLVLGGSFTTITIGGTSTPHNGIARLNSNGSLDPDFNPNVDGNVNALALQTDGKLVLAGYFTTITVAGVPTIRHSIARLQTNGALDATFVDSNVNGSVYALALQVDGELLLGGDFTMVGSMPHNRIARLYSDGILDSGFDLDINGNVYALTRQADGKFVLGGGFTMINGTPHNAIARINPNDNLDAGFNSNVNSAVYALAQQADDKWVVGGYFTQVNGEDRNHIARLYPDGSLDTTLSPAVYSDVNALALQADGKIVLGGSFLAVAGHTHNRIARLNPDGSLDATFDVHLDGPVHALVLQADGKLVLGGSFTSITIGAGVSTPRSNIARLNPDGSLDTTFAPNSDDYVNALVVQAGGKLVLGGSFTTITIGGASTPHNGVARLNPDGSLDPTFADPNVIGIVNALAVQADGRLVLGGNFTSVGGVARDYIARLDSEGNVDGFNPGANSVVNAIAQQGDGKLVLGGSFTTIGGTTHNCIARLQPNGSVDTDFNSIANYPVMALALQTDGRLLLGGYFTTINGAGRNHIARLHPNGLLDSTLYDPLVNDPVLALALQGDGKLVLGGLFTSIGGLHRSRIARLSQPQAALQSLTLSGNTVTWRRSEAAPELAAPPQLLYSDGSGYSLQGTMTRIAGGWRYSGLVLPVAFQAFYLRTQGQISSGESNGSQGTIESTRQVYNSNDLIFANDFESRPLM